MQIEHQQQLQQGAWLIEQSGQRLAEMTYSRVEDDGRLNIEHTWVDDSLRGQRIGQQLLQAAVEFARMNELKIVPFCPYVKSMFARDSSLQDVLHKDSSII